MAAKPNEIHLVRVYDAPLKTVWDAWVDPQQAAQWWGPRGFTLTTHSKDFRVGGTWKYTMHGPDGTDYPNLTTFLEIDPFKKMVYDHGATETTPPLFRVTVLFSERAGKTTMDMTMALATAEAAANTRKFIRKAGGESCWDRFSEYLGKTHGGKEFFVINRSFETGIETLFDLWTQPAHIARWLPPTGFTMEYLSADIRTGGSSFYKMCNGAVTMHGKAQYLELTKPGRIVYTQIFCDEHGRVARHPLAPLFPETLLTTIELTAEAPHQTRATVKMEPFGTYSSEELAFFLNARPGMTQGWSGSFDKLEEILPRTAV